MPLQQHPLSLTVVQMGMVSSIGSDLKTSCASARADVGRVSELVFSVVGEDGDKTAATGHQAAFLTHGFRSDARLIRLLTGALEDLAANVPHGIWPQALDVFVAMPASLPDDKTSDTFRRTSPWESVPTKPADFDRGRTIATKAMRLARVPSQIGRLAVITLGQASAAVALEVAAVACRETPGSLALVLAVDSLVDFDRLSRLEARGRLKSSSRPAGLSPGELGAAMLVAGDLETASDLPTIGRVLAPQSVDASRSFASGEAPDGRHVNELALAVARRLPARGIDPSGWCIVDLNGEPFRAREWGTALVHLSRALPTFNRSDVWMPAQSFGDVGAATGLAAAALALRGFARRYAPAPSALVLTASDGTTRAAFAVTESNWSMEDARE